MKIDVSEIEGSTNREFDVLFDILTEKIKEKASDLASTIMIKGALGKECDIGDFYQIHIILENMNIIKETDE